MIPREEVVTIPESEEHIFRPRKLGARECQRAEVRGGEADVDMPLTPRDIDRSRRPGSRSVRRRRSSERATGEASPREDYHRESGGYRRQPGDGSNGAVSFTMAITTILPVETTPRKP